MFRDRLGEVFVEGARRIHGLADAIDDMGWALLDPDGEVFDDCADVIRQPAAWAAPAHTEN